MPRRLGPSVIEKIRLGYADLDATLDQTAARLGVHRSTIVRLARACGWPKRQAAAAALRRPPAEGEAGRRAAHRHHLARLERISAQSAARIEAALSGPAEIEPERAARAFALHVRTAEGLR